MLKQNEDIKKIIRKVLPYCGLYVVVFLCLIFGAVLLQYWNMGLKQCMNPKVQKWEIEDLLDHAYNITADGDGYVTDYGDPYFILDVEYGQMVDLVLSGLPEGGSRGELYSAAEGEDFSSKGVQYCTYHNGHNLIQLPADQCDKIRVDIASGEGVHFEVKSIWSGSPWILFLMAYWKQVALLALIVVVFLWCI